MNHKPNEDRQPHILLVLRDVSTRNRLASALRSASYDVVTYSQMDNLPGLLAAPDEPRSYDLAIWDVEMLDEDTVRWIEELQSRSEFPPLILITAFSDMHALGRVRGLKTEAVFDAHLETHNQLASVLQFVTT